jgi:hypothetical protein
MIEYSSGDEATMVPLAYVPTFVDVPMDEIWGRDGDGDDEGDPGGYPSLASSSSYQSSGSGPSYDTYETGVFTTATPPHTPRFACPLPERLTPIKDKGATTDS